MSERVFGDIPPAEVVRCNWKGYRPFLDLARMARTTSWGLPAADRHVLGVLVMLEEAEAIIAHQSNLLIARDAAIAALESVRDEQAARIRGLELTIERMKKRQARKDDIADSHREA